MNIRLMAVLMVLCFVTPAVVADEVIYRVERHKLKVNPSRISGAKNNHQPVVSNHFVGENDRAAVKVLQKVPAQILPLQSLKQTSRLRKSAGYDPDFQYRCPWAWSELRREISNSVEYDRRQSQTQNQLPLHGGALNVSASHN